MSISVVYRCPNQELAIYGEELQLELSLLINFFSSSWRVFFHSSYLRWFGHKNAFFLFFHFYRPICCGRDNNEARKMPILDDLMAKRCLVLSLSEFY